MALGADHARQIAVQNVMDFLRIEGPAGTVDERGNAVFFGLWDMILETV